MGILSFYWNGCNARDFAAHNYDHAAHDKIELFEDLSYLPAGVPELTTRGALSDRIQNLTQLPRQFSEVSHYESKKETGYYLVDKVVRVTTASIHKDKQIFWTSFHKQIIFIGKLSLVLSGGVCAAMWVFTTPLATAALGIAFTALFFFAMMSYGRSKEAERQIKRWERNPVENVALSRTRAYEEGNWGSYFKQETHPLPLPLLHPSWVLYPSEKTYIFRRNLASQAQLFSEAAESGSTEKKSRALKFLLEKNSSLQENAIYGAYPNPQHETYLRMLPFNQRYEALTERMRRAKGDLLPFFEEAHTLIQEAYRAHPHQAQDLA